MTKNGQCHQQTRRRGLFPLSPRSDQMSVYPTYHRNTKRADVDARTVTISSLTVTNSRRRTVLNVVPNAFPATRLSATRDIGDNSVVEYVQVWKYLHSCTYMPTACEHMLTRIGPRALSPFFGTEFHNQTQQR